MATVASSVTELCAGAKRASRVLARVDSDVKNAALESIAAALEDRLEEILLANERDMQLGREDELGEALLDRLRLDARRVANIARAVRQIAALPDPVGEVIDGRRLPNGLDVRKVRVPLGVVAVVYEARPNVTIDAAALCLKSGNAIVLRGSSSAEHSNATLAQIASDAAVGAGLPDGCVTLVAGGGRAELAELATQSGSVDLIIPRGGEGLKEALQAVATVPVIYAASGNCHIYVDASADLDQAEAIVLNAKLQRPGVCNAVETLLVHEQIAPRMIPRIVRSLTDAGVVVRGDERVLELAHDEREQAPSGEAASALQSQASLSDSALVQAASEEDWASEYLALTLAVGLVDSTDAAIEHIGRYGSGHSEAILTRETSSARAFQLGVDAACVYVNASTRFTDGGEFGMGAEIGNSTQKLHARGPIGLRELCTFKYLVEGDGHVRS
ncbi:MAG TPA: glutamate-5-semialdehyde dehydrogenase [Solirubrobacteraceae bacterium]|jgi:glutamate-5-semialdehyde dehydrogenase|nr:glutamate-5-semialdehyde dehydrogenase [Solirubrobacteraceae bacterium]